jgi:hypothetical protein
MELFRRIGKTIFVFSKLSYEGLNAREWNGIKSKKEAVFSL